MGGCRHHFLGKGIIVFGEAEDAAVKGAARAFRGEGDNEIVMDFLLEGYLNDVARSIVERQPTIQQPFDIEKILIIDGIPLETNEFFADFSLKKKTRF